MLVETGGGSRLMRYRILCTREGGEEDDWTDETGLRHIVIHLPYKEVRRSADARPLMLVKVKERLGY